MIQRQQREDLFAVRRCRNKSCRQPFRPNPRVSMTLCQACWQDRRKARAAKRAQSRRRRGAYENLGTDWHKRKPEQLKLIRADYCAVCAITLKASLKKYESEFVRDHVVPVRFLTEAHCEEVSRPSNLMAICIFCHGRKRAAEEKLFRGNLIGYIQTLNGMGWPMERVRIALDSFGLLPNNARHHFA